MSASTGGFALQVLPCFPVSRWQPRAPWGPEDKLEHQACVVLANMYNALSGEQKKALRKWLQAPQADKTDIASQIVAGLSHVPAPTIHNAVKEIVVGRREVPAAAPKAAPQSSSARPGQRQLQTEPAEAGLRNATRAALCCLTLGRPKTHYIGDLHLIKLSGGDVGRGHRSWNFVDENGHNTLSQTRPLFPATN